MTYEQFLFAAFVMILCFLVLLAAAGLIAFTDLADTRSTGERRGRLLCRLGLHDRCEAGVVREVHVDTDGVTVYDRGTVTHCHRPGCTWLKTKLTPADEPRSPLP